MLLMYIFIFRCYHTCIHGICSEEPEYICVCDLGWTGDDCNTNCGCHNHSTCNNGIGLCDECQYWTEGDSCELCKPGSYGNATTETGCLECACNGHGDSSLNNCHGNTGICYCIDNTRGDHCEHCVDGYYGNPVNNNKCYKLCEGRTFLTNAVASAFGSHEGKGVIDASHGYCLWIITVFDNVTMSSLLTIPTITLTLEENLQIECQKDHVYVYDGIPESISGVHSQSQSVMLGAFCGTGLREPITVKATSGVMTVVFEANIAQSAITQGFTALYTIEECPLRCHGNRQCVNGHCVCMDRYRGSDCQIQICPQDCNQHLSQGVCDDVLGLCRCSEGFAGSACDILITSREVIWRTLYDPLLQAPSDNSYPSLSRMGHSMVAAENNELWVYGGYSLEEGIKRDVQMYDLNSHTWQVKSTSSINMEPLGRYYHAAVYTNPRTMFIHGGITELGIAKDFWVLDLDESEWTRVEIPFILPALAGHSMTLIRDRYIVILGGYSPEDGLSDVVVQYDTEQTQWLVLDVKGTPPTGLYGHSTVWNAETESLYIYGGYRFHTDQVALSDKLYAFYYPDKTWSILTASDQVKQLPRYLHAAVTTSQHLIILAGATENNFTNSVNLYKYECNTWTGLSSQATGGFINMKSVRLIKLDDIDAMGIEPRVQRRLLISAIKDIKHAQHGAFPVNLGCQQAQTSVVSAPDVSAKNDSADENNMVAFLRMKDFLHQLL
ncbi:multiple epidermal growth factor-like domains protein 8 [Saccoglossus kowalevskii]